MEEICRFNKFLCHCCDLWTKSYEHQQVQPWKEFFFCLLVLFCFISLLFIIIIIIIAPSNSSSFSYACTLITFIEGGDSNEDHCFYYDVTIILFCTFFIRVAQFLFLLDALQLLRDVRTVKT